MIHYIIGDATLPRQLPATITHVCNSVGGFGKGFVVSLRDRYPITERAYREWFAHKDSVSGEGWTATGPFGLGEVQFVQVSPHIQVANMIAQEGIRWVGGTPPIRYGSLDKCLQAVNEKSAGRTLHAPRMGSVLSGGDWETIVELIEKNITMDIFIYTLESQKERWPTNYEK